ncbi:MULTISPECIES: ArnT family glycosyltransferase [Frankia]|uniref:Glycosyl transferase, family 39 n=1 Tax=Frankia casuarinae (strain DSM 45818 / CECT 9043 / HFP020203 / CcI3) TaxID=106370 RepID=Q2JG86_FRACC|nr:MULTISPECIES: glycosyltransferase family 39 protein [unclassified Frankia]ABD09706.1 glycosyl transferase, family 39 [Frankia casuarinae]OHV54742.1 glycosyl transferase [Frankia sp. CgIS1]
MSPILTDPVPLSGGGRAPGHRRRMPWTRDQPHHVPSPDAPTETGLPVGGSGGLVSAEDVSAEDARWVRPALVTLLVGTGVLYLWGLGASGWANAFYSAAVQAGSVSWKAFFYGSSDAANSITVDKPPASLWVMALSVRIFGLSAWSILVPQALMGVATVGLLYQTVRRQFSAGAGLLAGAVLALTPVAALMFRFNNPDALLVLLLVAAAYATLRAIEQASTRWLVFAGVLVSFAFLTKLLQALLVVPVFALVYLVTAPTSFWRRVRQTLAAGLGLLIPAGLFIAIVELVPASSRPYIGGSQHNSLLELTLGYNGLGRLTGNETGSVGGGRGGRMGGLPESIGNGAAGAAPGGGTVIFGPGGPGGHGGGMWGQAGWTRMFGSEVGGQISWLLPTALILLVAGLWITRRAPRTNRARAAFLLWGGWLLVTGIVFSQMKGIFHAYYTVALAPAVGALVGMGCALLWRHRRHPAAAVVSAATMAATAAWCYTLLNRTPQWHPWIRYAVLVAGIIAALGFLAAIRLPRRAALGVATVALVAGLLGPGSYAIATAATPHTGSIPAAGPAGAGFGGPGGGRFFRMGQGGLQAGRQRGFPPRGMGRGAQGGPQGGGIFPGGAFPGDGQQMPGGQGGMPGQAGGGAGTGTTTLGNGILGGRESRGGGPGGLLSAVTPSNTIVKLLRQNADSYTWVAAAVGSNSAAGYQLATQDPVMPVGGFNGSDPSPTLAQFKQYVAEGKIHYFIGGGGFGQANGGSSSSREISSWVTENFTSKTVDGVTLYDLTAPKTGATTGSTTGTGVTA